MTMKLFMLTVLMVATVMESRSAPKEAAKPTAPNKSNATFQLYVTVQEDDDDEKTAITAAQPLRKHRAVLSGHNLTPGLLYTVTWRLIDPTGKSYPLQEPVRNFKSAESDDWIANFYSPPEQAPPPGKWRWEASVKDGPQLVREFTMLSPSADELDQLARHEAAREVVFHAFANYWTGGSNSYFTMLPQGLLQVSNLTYRFEMDYVSPADQLNGITYKGKASFSFTLYRQLAGEWGDWQDSVQYANSFMAFVGNNFFPGLPDEVGKGLCLTFTIQQRDGHWRVWAAGGAVFIDRRLAVSGSPSNRRVSSEIVAEALSSKIGTVRANLLEQAVEANKVPFGTNDDVKLTTDQLRGRPLQ